MLWGKSSTYKFRVPESDRAVYLTIVDSGDRTKVKSIFVNSSEMSSFQWVTALMTSYSRQIRSGEKVESIIQDMKESFDPNGGYTVPGKKDALGNQLEVRSIVHHIGILLEEHIND